MKIHKWKNYNTRWILPILNITSDSIDTTIGIGRWKWHMEFIFPKTIDAPFRGYEK
jgi:hypothetical protein